MLEQTYEFRLPVFKQGDDFAFFMDDNNDNHIKALEQLGAMYARASEQCLNLMTELNKLDNKEITMSGCTHMIMIDGPIEMLEDLADKELIDRTEFGDDEEKDLDEDNNDT